MIKPIIQYPTTPSKAFDGVVRHYDEALYTLLQDLKDTIEANNLEALAAYQIGSAYTVCVIKKENGDFLECINPIIITKEGTLTPTEKTAYFPNLTGKTKRYQKIKLTYEDRTGKQHFLTAEDDLAILIQRKTDYLLGADFRMRMNEEERNIFQTKLENHTDAVFVESCPTKPTLSTYLLQTITVTLIIGAIGVVVGFFVSDTLALSLSQIENYIMLFVFLLIIIYFFVAKIEGKKYTHCTSCQIGNIFGTALIQMIRLSLLGVANYFVF